MAQPEVLKALEKGSMTSYELSEKLNLNNSTIVRNIHKLKRQGLIIVERKNWASKAVYSLKSGVQ